MIYRCTDIIDAIIIQISILKCDITSKSILEIKKRCHNSYHKSSDNTTSMIMGDIMITPFLKSMLILPFVMISEKKKAINNSISNGNIHQTDHFIIKNNITS